MAKVTFLFNQLVERQIGTFDPLGRCIKAAESATAERVVRNEKGEAI